MPSAVESVVVVELLLINSLYKTRQRQWIGSCVFRGKSSTCSNRSRPLIPIQVDQ
jgi:hypothetical protein